MKEPEKILEAKDICKAYGKNMVLNQVNLTIKAGEIYGLVGENGAGKSSLMKVITGLTKPTSGEISLFGKKNLEDERNKIGCLIENPALYMDMTARQNLEIQRTQRGIPGKSSIDEVLEIMDLKDAGNKRVKAFSLGMKQRLGIAIALLGRPQLLILDEPINGLDPTKIKYVREVLKNMNEEDGTTILISSHILPELHQLATVYGFIHHGKMLQQITDKELDEKCRRHVHIEVDNVEKASCILDERYPESQIKVYLRNVIKVFDKDIENLALSINKRIKEDERKEHQLKKQDKNFKKMVANLSHDLRTPLTVIIGYLQLIRLEKNVNEPVNSYIEHIEKKADYLKKLVDDLYLLFWSEAIESEVDMKSVNITEVVTSLLKEYIQNSKRASEQLDIRLPHGNIWILAVFVKGSSSNGNLIIR